ncbi:MAG TPA: SurA N-terminal domain-containing protein [Verrucomicrobiae bacterium]|jgi:hypothetical protein
MIGTIRKHQNWLWGIIIAATIFTFVYYLSPNQQFGGGGGSSFHGSGPNLGSINGEAITPPQLNAAERESRLFYFLRTRAWPTTEEQKKQIRRMAEQNLVVESLIKDYKINPTTDAAARFAKQIFGVPLDQPMPQDKFGDWVQNELMSKGGLDMNDFDRFARHQTAQDYLMSLFGMSGELITPKEAEFFYRRENEPMVTEVVPFPTTNYYAATAPSDAELQDYFNKHQAEYRLPDRVQINYVIFTPSNYYAKADQTMGTNLEAKAAEIYHQQGPDAFKDEAGEPLKEAEAENKIKQQMREYAAMQEARKAANEFLTTLSDGHDDTHPFSTSDLEKLAKARGMTVKTTEPFDEETGNTDLELPPKSIHVLFSLRSDAPEDAEKSMLYAPSPLVGESGVYVAGLQKRFPSALQPLTIVRARVIKDYRDSKSVAMSKDAGDRFAVAAQTGLSQGKTFDAICAEQHVKPISMTPFALVTTNAPSDMDKQSFQRLQEAVFSLPVDQSSRYIPTGDGGVVAYVKARLPVNQTEMTKELPVYLARMREQRQVAAFQEWLNRQIQLRLIPPPEDQNGAG